jgi:hypothetical protein
MTTTDPASGLITLADMAAPRDKWLAEQLRREAVGVHDLVRENERLRQQILDLEDLLAKGIR